MSLDTTATTEWNEGIDLIEKLIQSNRINALKFKRLARKDSDSARKHYYSLSADVQDYVKYSPISQSYYNKLFNDNGKSKNP